MNQALCSACGTEDAFRYCRQCEAYFCSGCLCVHLSEEVTAVEPDEKGSPLAGMETSDENAANAQAPTSGVSWLSNATIIGGMTDAKIRTAINHYRTLVAILQAELVARELGTRHYRGGHGNGSKVRSRDQDGNRRRTRRVPSETLDRKVMKLAPEAMQKLIAMLKEKANGSK